MRVDSKIGIIAFSLQQDRNMFDMWFSVGNFGQTFRLYVTVLEDSIEVKVGSKSYEYFDDSIITSGIPFILEVIIVGTEIVSDDSRKITESQLLELALELHSFLFKKLGLNKDSFKNIPDYKNKVDITRLLELCIQKEPLCLFSE